MEESGSRRRAEAALWRAAKAEGLPQSKTLREDRGHRRGRQVLDCASPPAFAARQSAGSARRLARSSHYGTNAAGLYFIRSTRNHFAQRA